MERLACYDAATGRTTNDDAQAGSPGTDASPDTAPERALEQAVSQPTGTVSMIDRSWAFYPDSSRYRLGFYRANYLLFGRYSTRVNNEPFTPIFDAAGVPPQDLDSTEAKFQISAKARVWATDDRRFGVWAGYTQQSNWQAYNDEGQASRPFRETNYQPEVFVSFRPGVELPLGFQWNLLNAGYNHESNGRSEVLSRSWDRLFAEFGIERGNLALFARAWYRLHESSNQDDNPDITDYLGYGDLNALYRWRGHSFQLGGRANFSEGHGAVQFGWTSPPLLGPFRGYVQVFSGYGESMIDYNWRQTTIGAGLALSDGL
jgi:phospholipase A1